VGHAQGGESALELRRGIAVIGHGIVAKEAQAVGVHDQRQGVLEKEPAKMLEMIPSGIGGDKDRAQEFSGMIIDGQQRVCLAGPGHHGWMGESCCHNSLRRERSQRRRALGRGSGWQMRLGKCARTKAATD
jgi:hypothetical protein